MCLFGIVFDTDAGSNFTREKILDRSWENRLRVQKLLSLYIVMVFKIRMFGATMLHVRKGEARKRVVWCVDQQRPVPILLDTSYIDRYARKISPRERKMISYNSSAVLLSTGYDSDVKFKNKRTKEKQKSLRKTHLKSKSTFHDVGQQYEEHYNKQDGFTAVRIEESSRFHSNQYSFRGEKSRRDTYAANKIVRDTAKEANIRNVVRWYK